MLGNIISKKEPKIINCNYCSDEIHPFKAFIDKRFDKNVFCSRDCADNKYDKNSN